MLVFVLVCEQGALRWGSVGLQVLVEGGFWVSYAILGGPRDFFTFDRGFGPRKVENGHG